MAERIVWNKGKKFPELSGVNAYNYKGGKNKCTDCSKLLSNRVAKKCRSCNKIGNAGSINCLGNMRYNWISDRTKLSKGDEYRNSPAHREWSRSVKNRDGWKCKISNGDCSGQVVAHHILSWRDYAELRYQINNGITLCHAHHPRGRAKEKLMSPYFMELLISK